MNMVSKLKKMKFFSLADAVKSGISHTQLYRMVERNEIEKVTNGLYKVPGILEDPVEEQFAIACKRHGIDSAITGPSALAYYGLTDSPPQQIWLVTSPKKVANPQGLFRQIRSKGDLHTGIEDHGYFRIATLERTLAECLHFSSKIGNTIGITAIREAVAEGMTGLEKIREMAHLLGYENAFKRSWEALII